MQHLLELVEHEHERVPRRRLGRGAVVRAAGLASSSVSGPRRSSAKASASRQR
jgi:hypothetical protein